MNNNYSLVFDYLRDLFVDLGRELAKIDNKAFAIYQQDEEFDLDLEQEHAVALTIDGESNFKYYLNGEYDTSDLHVVIKVFSQIQLPLLQLLVDTYIRKRLQHPDKLAKLMTNGKALDEKLTVYGISQEVYDKLEENIQRAINRDYGVLITLKQHATTTEARQNGDNTITLMLGLAVKNVIN